MSSFIPNQIFTTSGSLIDLLDKRLMVVLRDGRKIIGFLRSYDQFANLVLQDSVERIYVKNFYGDIDRGVFLIRGENVVLLGEIDNIKDDDLPLTQLSFEEVVRMRKEEADDRQKKERLRNQLLHNHGFSVDFLDTDLY
ncbi:hypothetical protein H4R33_004001 [Dimargaris cristalligena]|uniref:U6 snRNA-associated Sm-like protein LSm1 n=1 Tax=Dimargaris cristalligena TaxID=215637 RepID=A0A4V1J511_9FUNG|nr:hypothetical protein H4R33_004001 [Dimargaris cristalligena]RKP37439.1 hypothetical protein BJ085DRAFT_22328 [Dimargaris cristalligena]|eukprot:RKP37439.1 hypothetical protein BJ085DRAFT_22328 [Dimargaris cristalligena]